MNTAFFLATVFSLLFIFAMVLVSVVVLIILPRERGKPRSFLEKERHWYYVRMVEDNITFLPNEILVFTFDSEGPMYASISRSAIEGTACANSFVRVVTQGTRKVYEFRPSPSIDKNEVNKNEIGEQTHR